MSAPRLVVAAAGLGLGLVWVSPTVGAGGSQDVSEFFPNTTERGSAVVQYDDGVLEVVASYVHSQRHHESRWLFMEMAAAATEPMRIARDDVWLETPDGHRVPVADQRTFREDRQRTAALWQRVSTTRHPVGTYFKQGRPADYRWYTLTLEGGTVTSYFDIHPFRASRGDLFFASPTGSWAPGTYSLVVEGRDGRTATLPITLG